MYCGIEKNTGKRFATSQMAIRNAAKYESDHFARKFS
jgi:hypothetical protein